MNSSFEIDYTMIVYCALAYGLGTIPFGILWSKVLGTADPRTSGSGNIGATNLLRTGGRSAGVLTLLSDLLKGALVLAIARWNGASPSNLWIVGTLAVLGHCFSPWLRFKGGKGVATGLGVYLVLSPWVAAIALIAFVLVFVYKRIVSIASLAAVMIATVCQWVVFPTDTSFFWVGVLAYTILLRHQKNMELILEDREHHWKS